MKILNIQPQDIENKSFEIISDYIKGNNIQIDKKNDFIIKRAIHTSADFDYANNLYFTKDIANELIDAIKLGADIITDTNMAKSGINKNALEKFGGTVHCFMSDKDVIEEAMRRKVTRAIVSMEKIKSINKPYIIAIGNAPTALIRVCELIKEGKINPVGVIGVPVGFVNVIASKELLISLNYPCIVARGRKGGSNIAAAIVNSLLYKITRE